MPESSARIVGTKDYLADTRQQAWTPSGAITVSTAGWDVVHGELISFTDSDTLGALDALEGFTPGEDSLYERILTPVEAGGTTINAWVYEIGEEIGVHLPHGYWPA